MTPALYQKLLYYAVSILKNRQDAEDVMQTVSIQLLAAKDIVSLEWYARKTIYNAALRFKSVKNRSLPPGVPAERIADELIEDIRFIDPFLRPLLVEAIYTLTPKQKEVITQALAGKDLNEMPGPYMTNKTHYRLAVLSMRAYFNAKSNKRKNKAVA